MTEPKAFSAGIHAPLTPALADTWRVPAEATGGDDTLLGTARFDAILGGEGDDLILGRGGDDMLSGDVAYLDVDPSSSLPDFGDDTILGGAEAGAFYGDLYQLLGNGGSGGDLVVRFGSDVVVGGDGPSEDREHSLFGDAFIVDLRLEGDDDILVLYGDDTVHNNGLWEGLGYPAMTIGDSYWMVIDLVAGTGSVVLEAGNDTLSGGNIILGDAYDILVTEAEGFAGSLEVISGADVLIGDETTTELRGDVAMISAQSGHVVFIGGDDTLVAGSGDEWISGDCLDLQIGAGAEITMVAGRDTFIFRGNFGNDVIADFDNGLDRLVFEGFGTGAAAALLITARSTGDLVLDLGALGGGTVTLLGVSTIDAADILFG